MFTFARRGRSFFHCNHLWRSSPLRVWSHALFNLHSSYRICFSGNITGAGRFSGLKTEQIVERTPLVVLSFLNSNTLIPNMSEQGESASLNMCTVIAYSCGVSSMLSLHHRNLSESWSSGCTFTWWNMLSMSPTRVTFSSRNLHKNPTKLFV